MSRSVLQRPSHRFRKPPRRRLVDSLQTALLSAAALVLLPSASSAASPPEPVPVARFSSVARAGPLPQPALSPTSRMQSGADASVEDRGRQLRLRPGSLDGGTSSRSRGDFVSLSGNKVSTGMTLYYLYPGACTQRYLGTWSPQSNRTWDDLNSYAIGTPGPYNVADESLDETLWHAYDASMTPADQRPSALDGNRSIWCGKYDPNWVRHVGYPNRTYQILYIDTGAHAADYVLTFIHRFGVEKNGDFIYLIGGGGGATDPIGNSRNSLDAVIANGASGDARLLVRWTGNIDTGWNLDTRSTGWYVEGTGSEPPVTVASSITIAAQHRALYLVMVSNDYASSEDGQWPDGEGAVIDQIGVTDNGSIYSEQTAAGGTDTFGGSVLVGVPAAPVISARVAPGYGTLWSLYPGNMLVTNDQCNPSKMSASDLIFFGGDPVTRMLVPGEDASIQSCAFPIPAGTAKVIVRWDDYIDLPKGSGFVQDGQYRFFQGGSWHGWEPLGAIAGSLPAWTGGAIDMADAAGADSIQVRWSIRCIPSFSSDGFNCQPIYLGLLYDNLSLEVQSGYPVPELGIFPGSIAQTTFVDGTMTGLNCTVPPCWPGIRGTDLQTSGNLDVAHSAIKDNFNAPLGDSIVVEAFSSLRPNGMGVNWHRGFSRSFSSGLAIAYVNGAFNPAYDTPRMIYRLFDPTTLLWSPFDSTELDADNVVVGPTDTTVVFTGYRMNWPPRDKGGLNLPGGFTINGIGTYNSLRFLPRGARIQYYFKVVDINGVATYQFSPELGSYDESELPTLPGSSIVAPGIMEFDVLPGIYPVGSPGSLLAGAKKTPVLNLDATYGYWVGKTDPVTRALRGLGVRADRYRALRGLDEGNNIGGRELPGMRPRWRSNYFPNMTEYSIRDSLAAWYRIMIVSSDKESWPILDEQDARLLREWWQEPTGVNSGDRCLFANGDDFFRYLLAPRAGLPSAEQFSLAHDVFGVNSINDSWNGSTTVANPTIDDRFAAPGAGPGLAAPGSFTYMLNTKCQLTGRFDALTKIGDAIAVNAALYPAVGGMTDVAGVAVMDENDAITDTDRSKSMGYGFSIQPISWFGAPFVAAQLQVLYKFLTSCRGPNNSGDPQTCWPCPTDATMITNWAASASFQTATYGPLYPIQDYLLATAVNDGVFQGAPAFGNSLAQNRPNPFNPSTTISYTLSRSGRVVIRVYDVAGRCVATLKDQLENAGPHQVRWSGLDDSSGRLASGIYFYRITYPDGATSARRMTILR